MPSIHMEHLIMRSLIYLFINILLLCFVVPLLFLKVKHHPF